MACSEISSSLTVRHSRSESVDTLVEEPVAKDSKLAAAPAKLTIKIKPTSGSFRRRVVHDESLHHHYFWDDAGDFVFTADRKVYFCVKSAIFFGRSSKLVKLAGHCDNVLYLEKGTTHDWECLLGLLTNNDRARLEPTMREAISVYNMARWYDMPVLRTWAEMHLRHDYFYTPDEVRGHSEERAPRAIDGYEQIFGIPRGAGLDPCITTLAYYAALINVEWDDDDEHDTFLELYPRAYQHIMHGRRKLLERYTVLLESLIQVPDKCLHVDDAPMSCKEGLLEWFPVEQPEDVVGTIDYLLEEPPFQCCDACCRQVEELVSEARDQVWSYLPRYFNVWVPQATDGNWLLSASAESFLRRDFKV